MSELRGGIDLGGTKIQTVVVEADGTLRGEARQPTPTSGGPADVARAMEDTLREAAAAAGVKPEELAGVGVGSPGDANGATGVVSGARNLPGWEGSFPLGETLAGALGADVRIGNDVQVAVEGEYAARRRQGARLAARRLVGNRRRRRPDPRRQAVVGPRRRRRARPHRRQAQRRPLPLRTARLPGGLRRPRRDGSESAPRAVEGVKTDLFEIMEKRGKDRLTSSVWEHALREGDA